jgi:hypothetical protein
LDAILTENDIASKCDREYAIFGTDGEGSNPSYGLA